MEFSTQAMSLIKRLKDFNEDDFREWFLNQRIGTSYVFQYLEWRDRNDKS